MAEGVILHQRPSLQRAVMVAGFSGWLDGGAASTGIVAYLVEKLAAKELGVLPGRDFSVYQVPGIESLRPHVKTEDGVIMSIDYPDNQFFYWINDRRSDGHDLIILQGLEPNLYWREYTGAILDLAEQFGVQRVYSCGGVLDRAPYTKEPLVSASVSDTRLKDELASYAVRFSNYSGPATFNSALVVACKGRGIEAIHFTSRAMYYPEFNIVVPHNPKVIYGLMKRLNRLLQLDLELSDLAQASRELENRLHSMVEQDTKLQHYIERLERNFVEQPYEEPIEGAPEDFVRSAEEFLKRQLEEEQ